ncbi:NADH-cytochrome b5 reductase [Tolypocladium paradoxum]|uniref:NADH-cytochrome b5 reductase n=1 Tax=Tolypocladium paradoxum TaxID=94208 RepID=A0A2S4L2M3_9HYPO|nr:NADH-cytochrome b5 reductase [Tolypocladium paradoxum]
MFARSAFRAAQPLRMHARRYATESAPKGGSNTFLYLAGGAALAGAGYWYLGGTPAAQQAEAKIKQATGAAAKPAFTGGDQGFVSLKLVDVENVNHNTKRFRFELPEGDMVSGLHIASAILTKYKGPNDEKATLRPYTPISDEGQAGYMDLLVKRYPDGPMSTHLHSMAPGQRLDFKGPLPKYPWAENKHEHIGLIAGGTGITPMYQLLRSIFSNPNDKTKVTLVFGNVTEEDILLKKELAELENTYPQRFRAFYVLDKAPKSWQGSSGFITKDLLKTVLPEPKSDNIKVFVCGPPGLMKAISGNKVSPKDQGELTGALKDLGYTQEQVYKF